MKKLIKKIIKLLFGEQDGVFYINGPETLPPPLSPEEEMTALSDLRTNDRSKELLIEHNLRLVVYIAKKFNSDSAGMEDLISIGTIGLIKAINTFDPEKNIKLATYASRCIENEILMYIRKTSGKKCEISIDEPINVDWDGNELLLSDILGSDSDSVSYGLETNEDRKTVRNAIRLLNDRDRLIISLRFGLENGKEKTQKEVADMLGISQSYISRLEKRIIDFLRKEIGGKI